VSTPTIWAMIRARRTTVLVGLLIGGLALTLALWGVPLADVGATLKTAQLIHLLPVAGIFLLQQALRGWRQWIILRATHPNHTLWDSFSVLCIGFFLINNLPARIGELGRPLLLRERGIELGTSFAMVFLERALDLAAMFAMIGAVAMWVPVDGGELVVGGRVIDWVGLGRTAAVTAVPILLGLILTLLLGGRPLLRAFEKRIRRTRFANHRLLNAVLGFGSNFVDGLEAVRQPGRMASILVLTVATWGVTGLLYPHMAAVFGVGEVLNYGEGMGVLGITMMGLSIPSAPGFAGTYEAFCRGGVALFGMRGGHLDAIAIAFALTLHWWLHLVQTLTAVFFLIFDKWDLGRICRDIAAQLSGEVNRSDG